MFQVQCQAALVPVGRHELAAHAPITKLTGKSPGVSGQRLDLDDLGSPIAKCLRGVRTKKHAGEIQDLDAGERTCGWSHRLRALVQQGLEIGARGLRLALRGLGSFAKAEIAVNKPGPVM